MQLDTRCSRFKNNDITHMHMFPCQVLLLMLHVLTKSVFDTVFCTRTVMSYTMPCQVQFLAAFAVHVSALIASRAFPVQATYKGQRVCAGQPTIHAVLRNCFKYKYAFNLPYSRHYTMLQRCLCSTADRSKSRCSDSTQLQDLVI